MARWAKLGRVALGISLLLLITLLFTPFKVYIIPSQAYPDTKGSMLTLDGSDRQPKSLFTDSNLLEAEKHLTTDSKFKSAGGKFYKMNYATLLTKVKEASGHIRIRTKDNRLGRKKQSAQKIGHLRKKVVYVQEAKRITKKIVNVPEAKRTFVCSSQVPVGSCHCTRVIQTRLIQACPRNSTTEELLRDIKSTLGVSSCGETATLRGAGQKVVSFSVYGKYPSEYYDGVRKLVGRVRQVYPGWTARVYLDPVTPNLQDWVCSLACEYPHLDFCNVRQLPALGDVSRSNGQNWRFAVMGDTLVERYLVRDTDSPILQREVDAVRQWLSLGKCYHVMRDNPFHGVVMLAGMWGGCNTWKTAEARTVRDYALRRATSTLQDQNILETQLWPLASLNVTVHDAYTCMRFGRSLPFPSQRVKFTFVGQRSYRSMYLRERTHAICPHQCRPENHKDWLYC